MGNIFFAQTSEPTRSHFRANKNNTISCPVFIGQRFNNLQRAALLTSFWRHRFNNLQRAALLTSLVQYDGACFQIWWTEAGYGELCVWFQPIRNGLIFWMNNNAISYISNSEIPSELSRENFISSHEKRSPSLWLHNKSRLWKQADLVFHCVFTCLWIWILSSPVQLDISRVTAANE